MNQSVVKWLVDELEDNGVKYLDLVHETIEKAEEMEKEQRLAPINAAIAKLDRKSTRLNSSHRL